MPAHNLADHTAIFQDGEHIGSWGWLQSADLYSAEEIKSMAAAFKACGQWGFYCVGNAFAEYILSI